MRVVPGWGTRRISVGQGLGGTRTKQAVAVGIDAVTAVARSMGDAVGFMEILQTPRHVNEVPSSS